MRRLRLVPSVLLACCTRSASEADFPTGWCEGETTTGDLAAAIQGADEGDVLLVPPGDYPAIAVDKAIILAGVDGGGRCLPPLGEGGPVLAGLALSGGAKAGGLRVKGPLELRDNAQARWVSAEGAATCVALAGEASIDGFRASGCEVGLAASGGEARNGLLVRNRGPGAQVEGAATLSWLTAADNGGDGVRLAGEGAVLVNSVLANNAGYGLWEEGDPRVVQRIAFSGNQRGQYGAPTPAAGRQAFRPGRDGAAPHLLPGDVAGGQPPLATRGVIQARYYASIAWDESYKPASPLARAWQIAANPYDAFGSPRAPDARVGAVESGQSPPPPAAALVVSAAGEAEGDGSAERPFRSLQRAVDAAADGQRIEVLPGTYAESVYVSGKDVALVGVPAPGEAPFADPADAGLPVIDPPDGAPHFGIYLESVGYRTLVQGLAVQGALTGVAVVARGEDSAPAPRLEALRLEGNRKGIDADGSSGLVRGSLLRGNRIGVALRSVSRWRVGQSRFEENGTDIAFSFVMLEADEDSVIEGNTFAGGGGLRIDALLARGGRRLRVIGNTFERAPLMVGVGAPGSAVEIAENRFVGADLAFAVPSWAAPAVELRGNAFEAGGKQRLGEGGDGVLAPPPGPGLDGGFAAEERRVWPASAPIAAAGERVYAVAADFDGVGVFDRDGRRVAFAPAGDDPRSLALTSGGRTLLVANFGSGTLSLLDAASGRLRAEVPVGVEPFGVAADEAGRYAYVSVAGEGRVAKVDLARREVVGSVDVPDQPRGLAIYGEGSGKKLIVTHFVPGRHPALPEASTAGLRPQLSVIDLPAFQEARQIDLPLVGSAHFPDAAPTLMQSVVIRGKRAYLPSFGANLESQRDLVHGGRGLAQFEATLQALLTVVDVEAEAPLPAESVNLSLPGNPLNGPYGIAFAPDSDLAIVPLYGNDSAIRLVVAPGAEPRAVRPWRAALDLFAGGNPRGAVLAGDRAYTVNFASGDLTTIDLGSAEPTWREPLGPPERDRLDAAARQGKQLFYTTFRVDSAANFWIACGSCHPDGRSDGLTWSFPNGPRSTPQLAGSMDTLPLHFDADRDELADFEHTIRDLQGGFSLIAGAVPPEAHAQRIGPERVGPWATIEAYLRQGIDAPRAPPATGREEAGRAQFARLGCQTCHGGARFTASHLPERLQVKAGQISATVFDVGTRSALDTLGSGGFDPPSLWGLAQTAPYLHDGAAADLAAVLANPRHRYAGVAAGERPRLAPEEEAALLDFLRSIDASTPAIEPQRSSKL